jgi:hypothetical protein
MKSQLTAKPQTIPHPAPAIGTIYNVYCDESWALVAEMRQRGELLERLGPGRSEQQR